MPKSRMLRYTSQGAVRTGFSTLTLMMSAFIGERAIEGLVINDLRKEDDTASALHKKYAGPSLSFTIEQKCDFNEAALDAGTLSEESQTCLEDMYKEDFPTTTLLVPAILALTLALKYLPKGLAYLNLAFHEATHGQHRVLTQQDLERFRTPNKTLPESSPN